MPRGIYKRNQVEVERLRLISKLSSGMTGKKHSKKSIEKMRLAHSHPLTKKHKQNIRRAHLQRKIKQGS